MESVFAFYDGDKFIPEKELSLKKGQKVIVTILDEEIKPSEEASAMYDTAIRSGAFNYLFEEGEHEYTINDCKEKYK